MIQPTTEAIHCPEECRCERFGYLVDCSNSRLNNIPLNLPTHVRQLVLDGNSIYYFENDSFVYRGLVLLKRINANSCKIRKIELGAFNGLTMLTYLSLAGYELSNKIVFTLERNSSLELRFDVNKLEYLHPDTFAALPNLQSLDLSSNYYLQIPTYRHFINSRSLKHLNISNCRISSMSVEIFANVSALEWLDLRSNFLLTLDINILKVLPELSELILRHNGIHNIIPGNFEKKSSLKYLHLDHNYIEHLEIDVFRRLVNLRNLSLHGNKLQYLHPDTFAALPNLQRLDLSENVYLQIPTDHHFINSHSLKHLDISKCNISSVSVEIFANVSALEWLDLSYNKLKILDINILKALPNLSALYLYGNPLQCDCQLQEVWRLCQDHNIQTAYEGKVPECDTPRQVKGIWWGVLEKGQCLQGQMRYYGDYKNTRYRYTPIKDMDMHTKADTDTGKKQGENIPSFLKPYELPVSAILFIFGTTANVILIIIIISNKDMRTVPNMYLLSLATSDIIYLTAIFSIVWLDNVTWLRSDTVCTLLTFFNRMSVGLTVNFVTVLSIRVYKLTVNPFHVRVSSQPVWLSTVATIFVVWIVAAFFAIPAARSQYMCVNSILLWLINYYLYVLAFQILVSFVLPFFTICFFCTYGQHFAKNVSSLSEETQISRLNKRKNAAKLCAVLSISFTIIAVFYHMAEMYFYSSISLDFPSSEIGVVFVSDYNLKDIIFILQILLSIKSCLNPIVLFFTILAFRRHFKRYLTRCFKTNSPPNDFEHTQIN